MIKYHQTVETIINALIDNGFVLRRVLEPVLATMSSKVKELDLHNHRPPFLLVSAERRG